jgi:hypothetical protein
MQIYDKAQMQLSFSAPLRACMLLACACYGAFGQTQVASTTLAAAMASGDTTVSLTSTTGILARDTAVNTELFVDHELMEVIYVSPNVVVNRGVGGSRQSPHAANAKVWFSTPPAFWKSEPAGACTAQSVTPAIVVPTGDQWICPSSGPNAGVWSKSGPAPDQAFVFTDGVKYVSPGACLVTAGTGTVGTAYGTLRTAANETTGQMTVGASGNGTFLLTCEITESGRTLANKGNTVTGVSLLYGAQTAAITSIAAATLDTVVYPAAGATAAGTVASAGGSLTVTPSTLVLTTTTTGQCNNEYIALGTPLPPANLQRFTLEQSFTLANSGVLQICGVLLYYTEAPL